jgi:hypothetical protein
MFGDEPPEQSHTGHKIIQIVIAVLLLIGGIVGLVSGHFFLPSMTKQGYALEGLSAYLVAISFISLSALFFITLVQWTDEFLYKVTTKFLFFLFLVLFTIGFFIP